MGVGGTVDVEGLEVTMVPAVHTSSVVENDATVYLGEPAGFVVRIEDKRAIYFAGDTALFGDMRLIAEMYAPRIAFLPIGDHFTMGPDGAARAARCSACGRWCRCTTARSRCSPARPRS